MRKRHNQLQRQEGSLGGSSEAGDGSPGLGARVASAKCWQPRASGEIGTDTWASLPCRSPVTSQP